MLKDTGFSLLKKAIFNPKKTLTSIGKAIYKAATPRKLQSTAKTIYNIPEVKAGVQTITQPRKVIKEGLIGKKGINLIGEKLTPIGKSIRKGNTILGPSTKSTSKALVGGAIEQLGQFLSTPYQTSEKNKEIIKKIKSGKVNPIIGGIQATLGTGLAVASTVWKPMMITANMIGAGLKAGNVDESMNKAIEGLKSDISKTLVKYKIADKNNSDSIADSAFNFSMLGFGIGGGRLFGRGKTTSQKVKNTAKSAVIQSTPELIALQNSDKGVISKEGGASLLSGLVIAPKAIRLNKTPKNQLSLNIEKSISKKDPIKDIKKLRVLEKKAKISLLSTSERQQLKDLQKQYPKPNIKIEGKLKEQIKKNKTTREIVLGRQKKILSNAPLKKNIEKDNITGYEPYGSGIIKGKYFMQNVLGDVIRVDKKTYTDFTKGASNKSVDITPLMKKNIDNVLEIKPEYTIKQVAKIKSHNKGVLKRQKNNITQLNELQQTKREGKTKEFLGNSKTQLEIKKDFINKGKQDKTIKDNGLDKGLSSKVFTKKGKELGGKGVGVHLPKIKLKDRIIKLQKQKKDLELRVKNKPELKRVDVFKEVTPIIEPIIVKKQPKFTKKRIKETKKKVTDIFNEFKIKKENKINIEKNILKKEALKIDESKNLIQENRMNEVIDSADTFTEKELIDNIYQDNILTDKSKLTLIDLVETKQQSTKNISNPITNKPPVTNLTKALDVTPGKVKFLLQPLQGVLQKIPVIGATLKFTGKVANDVRLRLNNIKIITGKVSEGLGNYISGIMHEKRNVVDIATKQYGIDNVKQWATTNKKIINKNVVSLKKILGDIYNKKSIDYVNAISHLRTQRYDLIGGSKDLKQLQFLSQVFNDLKNKGKDTSKYFTPEVSKYLNNLESVLKENKMTTEIGDILSDQGILKFTSEDYVRGVVNDLVFKYAKNNTNDIKLEGVSYEDFINRGYDPEILNTGKIPEFLSSILKKSKNAEQYHSKDPITRMLSYIDESAGLTTNKKVVDILQEAVTSDKKIGKYIGADSDGVIKAILGLHKNNAATKVATVVSGGIAAGVIIGNTTVNLMSGLTTLVRGTVTGGRLYLDNIITQSKELGKAIKTLDFKKVEQLLGIKKIELHDTVKFIQDIGADPVYINNTKIGKLTEKAYLWSSGGTYDNFMKALIANKVMRNQLGRDGIQLKKGDNTINKYKQLLESKTIEEKRLLQAELSREIADISDFSGFSKGSFAITNIAALNRFKNFGRTTLSRIVNYPTQLIGDIVSKITKGVSINNRDIAQRVGFLVSSLGLVSVVADKIINGIYGNNINEEEKKVLANRLKGGNAADQISMMLLTAIQLNALSLIAGGSMGLVRSVYETVYGGGALDVASKGSKILAVTRALNLFFKDTELTTRGDFKYNNKWGDSSIQNTLTFLLGKSLGSIDYEVGKAQIQKIQDGDKGLITKVIDNIFKQNGYFMRGLGDVVSFLASFKGDPNNKFNQEIVILQSKNNINQVLSNINNNKFKKLNTEQWILSAWDGLDVNISQKDLSSFVIKNRRADFNSKKALSQVIKSIGVDITSIYGGDMNKYMINLQKTNPNLYHNIIKKVLSPVVLRINKATKIIGDLKFNNTSGGPTFIDEMITDKLGSQRLASDIANRFSLIINKYATPKELESYNILIKTLKENTFLYDDVADGLALKLATSLKGVEGIKETIKDYPELTNIIQEALYLKGIRIYKQKVEKPTKISNINKENIKNNFSEKNITKGNTLGTLPISLKKKKKTKLADLIDLKINKTQQPKLQQVKLQTLLDKVLK